MNGCEEKTARTRRRLRRGITRRTKTKRRRSRGRGREKEGEGGEEERMREKQKRNNYHTERIISTYCGFLFSETTEV